MADAETPFEIERDGKPIAGAYPHPRMVGYWLAAVPPKDHRDSGLKRFKTRAGAVRFVIQRTLDNPVT